VLGCALAACEMFEPLDGLTGADGGGFAGTGGGPPMTDAADDSPAVAPDGGTEGTPEDGAAETSVPCDSGTACGRSCVDTQTDPANCGRCSHDCGGAGCMSGVCQPMVIATGQNGPRALFVSGSTVYWTNHDSSGTVASCPTTGCTGSPQIYATGLTRTSGITVSAGSIFFGVYGSGSGNGSNTGSGVFACSTSGCGMNPTSMTGNPGAIVAVVSDGTNVFWNDSGYGQVLSCAVGGCGGMPDVLASNIGTPWYGLATDANDVYFAGRSDGTVYSCPKAGCGSNGPNTIVGGLTGPFALAVDSDTVYVTTYDPNNAGTPAPVVSCPLTGCMSPTILSASEATPTGIAVDGSGVYWADEANGNAGSSTVAYCPKSGCPQGGPTVLASSLQGAFLVALDASFVYFTDYVGGQVMRVAKP
jgi:hypothetical protein